MKTYDVYSCGSDETGILENYLNEKGKEGFALVSLVVDGAGEDAFYTVVMVKKESPTELGTEQRYALAELLRHSKAALSALKSYQYGNSAPDLAEEVADELELALSRYEDMATFRRAEGSGQ